MSLATEWRSMYSLMSNRNIASSLPKYCSVSTYAGKQESVTASCDFKQTPTAAEVPHTAATAICQTCLEAHAYCISHAHALATPSAGQYGILCLPKLSESIWNI